MIKNTNQVDSEQLKEIVQLAAQCKKVDGSTPNLYTHILTQHRTFPASLLYYEGADLVGFLSAYFFYDEAVEISIVIHPASRKKGIAKELINAILPLIQFQNYFKLIFSSPANLNNQWLLKHGYSYQHSEYNMERDELSPILNRNQSLSFRIATINDIPTLSIIDNECFPQKSGDAYGRFQHLLDSREYLVLISFYNNMPIGKAHIRWQEQGATFSDIAIIPAQQGNGFGTSLIAYCINLALSDGKHILSLDVETHNQRALNLYTRLGFTIQNACDYWSIDIEHLLKK